MKSYLKEIIIILCQIFMYYIFPSFAGPTDAIGVVFLLIVSTFILSLILAAISDHKFKYFYPLITAIVFIPTIPIYYNDSALIHSLWYFVDAFIGLIFGEIINKLFKWSKKYEIKRTQN